MSFLTNYREKTVRPLMDLPLTIFFFFISSIPVVLSQQQSPDELEQTHDDFAREDAVTSFQPSLFVVIGVLSFILTLTFFLLLYAKFIHSRAADTGRLGVRRGEVGNRGDGCLRLSSGVDQSVVDSLPFFRYGSVKGAKEGLQCAVCLSEYEEFETLRLLPKCRHAFHLNCVDLWLLSHSSCPLCRRPVTPDDLDSFLGSTSIRYNIGHWNENGNRNETQNSIDEQEVELHLAREEEDAEEQCLRKPVKGRREGVGEGEGGALLHKLNHRIMVSDVVFQHRWSNVSSSDLMFLNSKMLNATSNAELSPLNLDESRGETAVDVQISDDDHQNEKMRIKEEMGRKRFFKQKINQIKTSNFGSSVSSTNTHPNRQISVSNSHRGCTMSMERGLTMNTRDQKRQISEIDFGSSLSPTNTSLRSQIPVLDSSLNCSGFTRTINPIN